LSEPAFLHSCHDKNQNPKFVLFALKQIINQCWTDIYFWPRELITSQIQSRVLKINMFSMNFDGNEHNILPLSYSLCKYPWRPWQSNNFGRKLIPYLLKGYILGRQIISKPVGSPLLSLVTSNPTKRLHKPSKLTLRSSLWISKLGIWKNWPFGTVGGYFKNRSQVMHTRWILAQ